MSNVRNSYALSILFVVLCNPAYALIIVNQGGGTGLNCSEPSELRQLDDQAQSKSFDPEARDEDSLDEDGLDEDGLDADDWQIE